MDRLRIDDDLGELTRRLSRLSPEQRALAEQLLSQRGIDLTRVGIPRRAQASDRAPLSVAQQRLWLLDRLYPGNAAYNVYLAVRFRGLLQVAALRQALDAIVDRHEILRAAFPAGGAEPFQVFAPSLRVPLETADLRNLPAAEREDALARHAAAEVRRPFSLQEGPLLRATLLHLAEEEFALLLGTHHIVCDGWSLGRLAQELSALYSASVGGRPSTLAPLPIQYADYAVWEREQLSSPAMADQLAYWQRQLAGLAPLQIGGDRAPTAARGSSGATVPVALGAELTARLRALSQREGVTLFMTLLAAFQALLARYSGQDDIAIGAPVAGRNRAELEPLVGFFINMLVLRTDLSGNPTVRDLLARVRKVATEAYAHQEAPFERLVELLHPERAINQTPLFQVAMSLQDARPAETFTMHGLDVEYLPVAVSTAKFDLSLELVEEASDIRGVVNFSTDRFDRAAVEGLVGHWQTLLGGMAADAGARLGELPLLTEAERGRLAAWNQTTRPYPREAGLAALFAAQVARAPDAVAVVDGGAEISYGALDRRANQLARHLRGLGVRPGALAGVYLERSIDLIVAMLAVVKAGGAYLPLDPEAPPARLGAALSDAGVAVVLTLEQFLGRLPAARAICLDRDEPALAAEAGDPLPPLAGPAHLAYAITTSGSTGLPKAVAVEQRAVARLVCNSDYVRLGPGDRVAHLSNVAFDAATFEVWGALLNGACLVVLDRDTGLAPAALAAALRSGGITTLFLTTALFNQVAALESGAFAPLREVLFGGERVDPAAVRRVLAARPPGRLLHVYGPTETTTFATWQRVAAVAPDAAAVPIGRPIANSTAHVLDRRGELLPAGVAGELYLGGDGVARGYLGRPALTAEKFVPDPYSAEPGARLYRTGDRVRQRPDGALEFLGRLDRQVKLRGFRIELGEVEAALLALPGIAQAAVALREDQPGDQRLVAYLVPERAVRQAAPNGEAVGVDGAGAGAGPDLGAVRRSLAATLPEYMLPGALVVLDALPLTPNGKLDRAALPAPERATTTDGYVAPRTPLEEVLADVWAELLGRERVGVHDDFFDMGGHSLLVTQAASKLRETLRVDVPLRQIFETPTVAGVAEALLSDPERGRRAERAAQLAAEVARLPDDRVDALLGRRADVLDAGGGA